MDELKSRVIQYNIENFSNFVIETNNKNAVKITCKHGRNRKSKCRGKRAKQHYNYLGCKAFVRLYKSSKKGTITVTQVDLDHCNHQTTKEIR